MSPTSFEMPRTNPRLGVWGDTQIKDALRQFKEIGGYMKEGVGVHITRDEESMEDRTKKPDCIAHCSSHQIPNADIVDIKSILNNVVDILERQTRVFERLVGSQVGNNEHEVANKHHDVPISTTKWPITTKWAISNPMWN